MAALAPSLARLRTETNTAWPARDHSSDGWIGDTTHQTSGMPENGGSDHNPNRRNIVDATDTDVTGIDPAVFVARAIRHPATNYVIYNRRIYSRAHGFASRAYTGSNPHDKHIHVSIQQNTAAENNTTGWGLAAPGPVVDPASWVVKLAAALPELDRSPDVRGTVRKLQTLLAAEGHEVTVDGVYGPGTATAVRAFQRQRGLDVDGIAGPKTWTALLGPLPILRENSKGLAVRKAQLLLNLNGATLPPDGVYGSLTSIAVRGYQTSHGLDVDGDCGPQTWTALMTR